MMIFKYLLWATQVCEVTLFLNPHQKPMKYRYYCLYFSKKLRCNRRVVNPLLAHFSAIKLSKVIWIVSSQEE